MKTVKLEIPKQPRISSISDESNLIEVDYSKNSINIFFYNFGSQILCSCIFWAQMCRIFAWESPLIVLGLVERIKNGPKIQQTN